MSELIIGGSKAEVIYKRGTNVYSSLSVIQVTANVCVYCDRHTDRWTATYRDEKPWKAIPCCDECHDNLRKLPSKEKPLIVEYTE